MHYPPGNFSDTHCAFEILKVMQMLLHGIRNQLPLDICESWMQKPCFFFCCCFFFFFCSHSDAANLREEDKYRLSKMLLHLTFLMPNPFRLCPLYYFTSSCFPLCRTHPEESTAGVSVWLKTGGLSSCWLFSRRWTRVGVQNRISVGGWDHRRVNMVLYMCG